MRAVPTIDPDRGFDQAGLRHRGGVGRELAVSDRAFQVLDVPCGWSGQRDGGASGVERPCGQRDRFAGLQDELGGRHEQRGGDSCGERARRGLGAAGRIGRRARGRHLRPDRVDGIHRHHVDPAARHGRRRDDRLRILLAAEPVLVENLRAIRQRTDDEELAVLGSHVQLAVGKHGRRFLNRAEVLFPHARARLRVVREQDAAVVDDVDALAVADRRGIAGLHAADEPPRVLVGQRAGLVRGHRGEHAHLARAEVLFAVRDQKIGSDHQRGRVQAALAHGPAPDSFAGGNLERVHGAVAAAGEERARAVDVGDERVGVDGVGRPALRRAEPVDAARHLVEREVAVRAAGVLSPAEHQAADDELIAVDDRRGDASAVRRPHAELFGERAFPEQLAVARQRHQEAVPAEGEHVAAGGIDHG